MRAAPKEDALRNALRLTLGIAVSLACLWYATRGTDWSDVGRLLAAVRPHWLVAAAVSSVVALLLRAQRWRLLLRPVADVPLGAAFSATAIGFAATSVLPLRLGEIIRPTLLARRVGFRVSAGLSSVVLERLFDMLFVLLCFLVLSLVYPLEPGLRRAAVLLGGVAILGLGVLVVTSRNRVATERIVDRVLDRLPGVASRVVRPLTAGFFQALGALRSPAIVAGVTAYSALVWSANALPFLFTLLALAIDVPLVPAALASIVIVAAFVFIPQGPGFVGTWQIGCVIALKLFQVPEDAAVSFSLLTWLLQMSINVGLGGFFVAREDISLRQLVRGAERVAAVETRP